MYDIYRSVAPDPGGWPALVSKTRQLLTGPDFDWMDGIARISAPTLLVFADADSIHPEHIVELFGLFGGGKADGGMAGLANIQLAILPGTTHYNMLSRPDLLPSLLPFLSAA
jgi:pimeloyl-ACP methyl ester carboxylesterase